MNQTSSILSIILAFGAIMYGLSQWRNGRTKKNADDIGTAQVTINLLNSQIEALTTQNKGFQAEQLQNAKDIAHLRGVIEQKDGELERYVKIFQGKDGSQDVFMKLMTQTAADSSKYMVETSRILADMHSFMQKMDSKLDAVLAK